MTDYKFRLVDEAADLVMSDLSDWNLGIIRDALTLYFESLPEADIKSHIFYMEKSK